MTSVKSQLRLPSLGAGLLAATLLCTGAMFVAGCENSSDGTMENAGEKLDDAMKDAGDVMEDAAKDMQDN